MRSLTGEEMSVLTATGERLVVPLAKVEIESGQGKHVELVGVLEIARRLSTRQIIFWTNSF